MPRWRNWKDLTPKEAFEDIKLGRHVSYSTLKNFYPTKDIKEIVQQAKDSDDPNVRKKAKEIVKEMTEFRKDQNEKNRELRKNSTPDEAFKLLITTNFTFATLAKYCTFGILKRE